MSPAKRSPASVFTRGHLNAWLLDWVTMIADQRVHGRAPVVANDALVSIDGSRYHVPAHLVGTTLTVRETRRTSQSGSARRGAVHTGGGS